MRYLPHTEADRQEMLAAVGASSVDELFRDIPAAARSFVAQAYEDDIRALLDKLEADPRTIWPQLHAHSEILDTITDAARGKVYPSPATIVARLESDDTIQLEKVTIEDGTTTPIIRAATLGDGLHWLRQNRLISNSDVPRLERELETSIAHQRSLSRTR